MDGSKAKKEKRARRKSDRHSVSTSSFLITEEDSKSNFERTENTTSDTNNYDSDCSGRNSTTSEKEEKKHSRARELVPSPDRLVEIIRAHLEQDQFSMQSYQQIFSSTTVSLDLLKEAIIKYEKWLTLKSEFSQLYLYMPRDLLFIYLIHTQSPVHYSKTCKNFFGKIIDLRMQTRKASIEETVRLWKKEYPTSPELQVHPLDVTNSSSSSNTTSLSSPSQLSVKVILSSPSGTQKTAPLTPSTSNESLDSVSSGISSYSQQQHQQHSPTHPVVSKQTPLSSSTPNLIHNNTNNNNNNNNTITTTTTSSILPSTTTVTTTVTPITTTTSTTHQNSHSAPNTPIKNSTLTRTNSNNSGTGSHQSGGNNNTNNTNTVGVRRTNSSLGTTSGPIPSFSSLFTFPKTMEELRGAVWFEGIAKYSFEAQASNELSFKGGDTVYVLQRNDDGWFGGELANGQRGFFPGTYCELIRQSTDLYLP